MCYSVSNIDDRYYLLLIRLPTLPLLAMSMYDAINLMPQQLHNAYCSVHLSPPPPHYMMIVMTE